MSARNEGGGGTNDVSVIGRASYAARGHVRMRVQTRIDKMAASSEVDVDAAIRAVIEKIEPVTGITALKAEQYTALKALLEGRDVFGVLPTGYGKSLASPAGLERNGSRRIDHPGCISPPCPNRGPEKRSSKTWTQNLAARSQQRHRRPNRPWVARLWKSRIMALR